MSEFFKGECNILGSVSFRECKFSKVYPENMYHYTWHIGSVNVRGTFELIVGPNVGPTKSLNFSLVFQNPLVIPYEEV